MHYNDDNGKCYNKRSSNGMIHYKVLSNGMCYNKIPHTTRYNTSSNTTHYKTSSHITHYNTLTNTTLYNTPTHITHYTPSHSNLTHPILTHYKNPWCVVSLRPLVFAVVLGVPSFGMLCACSGVIHGQYVLSGSVYILSYYSFLFWTCYLFSDQYPQRIPEVNLSMHCPTRKARQRSARIALLLPFTALIYAFSSCITASISGTPHVILLHILRLVQSLILASLIASYLGYAGRKQILSVSWISSLLFVFGLITYVSLHKLGLQYTQ